ncbi:BadF/BadG/BcrA/BcrD ATPase family protein [Gordonibacter faecis]|uniref:BadF/BadG/BcrA/BcrD ATPase family protein n=1 Tax=Gordonibacter faecis TaxID=3047475 RepID=A0ABT7DR01_9ACTN|nr:BadF/BadG/BcrA/BcrD ATPase family protein [Gordonibacter sp. KGMB12511]MDJ1650988.1 BadF/BadG/BcrA/BcrD ATPase family protein [Gordonibacter sp. KGMB12511]
MGYHIGIDAGSKTIKVVVLDECGTTVHAVYRRHRSDIKSTLAQALHELTWRYGDIVGTVGVTGSAGIGISEAVGLPFVQEVVATTEAVQRAYPQADALIELGGEDAKVVYLTGGLEQRMNATCAGGTGGFIDTVAYLIGAKPDDMSKLALGAKRLYPIASRCAVFAQADIRPLLNEGALKSDIAASALEAVVRQTLGGLACGRSIEGTVVFLGGPFEYLPELARRFRSALGLTAKEGIKPPDAHLFTARGAAFFGAQKAKERGSGHLISLCALEEQLAHMPDFENDLATLPPLFESEEDLGSFRNGHSSCVMPRVRLFDCKGPLYLGVDAGSTAIKLAVLDGEGRLAYSDYRDTGGEVLETAIALLGQFYATVPRAANGEPDVYVAHATACGYGEDVLRAGLGIDSGVVETLAHVRAAQLFAPDLTFLLDIGGQDMKALWVHEGRVTNAVLNEACSSGCGSFIAGTAASLRSTSERFSDEALTAQEPVDLGTKCTVFMTSRVRHAQKMGVSVPDIAAGIAYSVVRNALFRIIGADRVATLGDHVVVQGGAFKSDAVLRAFELVSGVKATRPDTAHLMGAIGAALTARARAQAAAHQQGEDCVRSGLIGREELAGLVPQRSTARCAGCGNNCSLSLVDFGGGRLFVSGNRCNRAWEVVGAASITPQALRRPPNVIALTQKLLARFSDSAGLGPRAHVRVGLMNTLNLYTQVPFWHAFFGSLGFSIVVPNDERAEESGAAREGAATVPSESVCYPARLAHTRLYDLVRNAKSDIVFMPRYVRGHRCPVWCEYADAVADCAPVVRDGDVLFVAPQLRSAKSASLVEDEQDRLALRACLNEAAQAVGCPPVTELEFTAALGAGHAAQEAFEQAVRKANERALAWARAAGGRGVVVGGRPYHHDPAVLHGIDDVLTDVGFAVLSPLGVGLDEGEREACARGSWGRDAHLARLARVVAKEPHLELVCLQSFGCGYDAASLAFVRPLLEAAGHPFTALKIDGIADTAHIRIRLRTLAEALEVEGSEEAFTQPPSPVTGAAASEEEMRGSVSFTPLCGPLEPADLERALRTVPGDVCFVVKALAGRTARMAEDNPDVNGIKVPEVCRHCLLDTLPDLVSRAAGRPVDVRWTHSLVGVNQAWGCQVSGKQERPCIGIIGNALLVFDAFMNDGVINLIECEGCEVVLPRPEGLFTDEVRYLSELDRFAELGVNQVIYLQAFGCLKGHVHARGALHGMAERYPTMPITVVDYDPEASALNRENRVLLAIAAAKQAFAQVTCSRL